MNKFNAMPSPIELTPGQKLGVADLDFYALLRRQGSDGRLYFNQRRAVLFDVEAMGALRQQLAETLGQEMANGVLMRFGYSQGYQDADTLAETFDWETEIDWLAAGPTLHMLEGVVQVEVQLLEFDRAAGHFNMHGTWRNSYEAEEYLKRFGQSDRPVCFSLTGYASGYATRFLGREALAIETQCVAKGDDHCAWEVRPLANWGKEAEPHLNALQQINIPDQLATLHRLEAQTAQLAALNQISTEFNLATSTQEVFKIIGARTQEVIKADQTGVALLDPAALTVELLVLQDVSGATLQGSQLPLDKTTGIGQAIETRQIIINHNVETGNALENRELARRGFQSAMVAPLITGNGVIGALNVASKTPQAYDEQSKGVFLQLASMLAVAIEKQRLIEDARQRAAQLEETTTFLDSILENIPAMIFVKEARELRFVRWNRAGEELIGFKNEDLIGKNDYDFFPKEEADFFTTKDRQVLNGGKLLDIPEEPIQTAGGQVVWLHTRKVPVLDVDGNPRYLLGISEDITGRKRFEEDLQKFKLGIERSNDAVFLTDINGTITYVNAAFEKIYGFTAEEAIGQTPRIIKSGLIPAEAYEHFWQTLFNKEVVAGEIVNKTKDGRLVNVEGSNNPIVDENGNIVGFLALHRDITERKQTAQALQESQYLYQTSIDGLPQNVYRIDRDGRVIFGNRTYLNTIGMTLEECLGKTAYDFFPKELADKYTADDQYVMTTGQDFTIVESHKVPSTGAISYVQTVKTPIRDAQGNIAGLQGVFWDITEQKQAELALTQRAAELETLSRVSRRLTALLDPDELMAELVEQVSASFNYYYTQIYLFDRTRQNLVLARGSGKIGQELLKRQHSLPVGRGLVGRAAEQNKTTLMSDVQRHIGVELINQTNVEDVYRRETDPAYEIEWYANYIARSFGGINVLRDWLALNPTQAAKMLELGYVMHVPGAFADMIRRGVDTAARDLQVKVDFKAPERFGEHLPLFEAMVDQGKDGLVVIPDTSAWIEPIEQALSAGIPVITSNRDLKFSPASVHVGLDNFQSGVILARELLKLLAAANLHEGKILLSNGVPDRQAGVEFGLRHTNYTLIAPPGFSEVGDTPVTYWQNTLQDHPDAIAIIGLTVTETPLLAQIKRRTGARWLLAGYDLDPATIDAIREGLVEFAVGQHPYLQGYLPIMALVEHLRLGVSLAGWLAEGWLPNALLPETRVEVAIPISLGGNVLGVLDIQHNAPGALKPETVNVLRSMTDQIAVALQNAGLFEQAQTRAQREHLLREVTARIRGSADVDTVMRVTALEVGKALGRRAFVVLGDKENGSTEPAQEREA